MAERIRAGGAGIPAFYTPTAVQTELGEGKETREFNNRRISLEHAIVGDYAFVRAFRADRWGNLIYRKAQRNFDPVMATGAKITIARSRRIVELGEIDPETMVPRVFTYIV